ncbi:phosphoglycerate dehydrogenase [Hyphobacterium sp. CCMP332]|nr:phosphoglycerate dehydrogenase [Hyphobacterium sp. CCMP332]
MEDRAYYVIDFDSTFTQVEAMDILADISLKSHPEKDSIKKEIVRLTDLGMEGKLTVRESLIKRIELLKANKNHLQELVELLKKKISKSFRRNEQFFSEHTSNILIISNGFKDFVVPVVTELGVLPQNVYANSFEYDENGNITGVDTDNVLSDNDGKVKQLQSLKLNGEIFVIGDGFTDYEIKQKGIAKKFYAFTENVKRDSVVSEADHIAPSLDEFLYKNKLTMAISYPKNRIKVLVLENIHSKATELFSEEGYELERFSSALDEDELSEKIKNVSILCIRSKTNVTAKVLENANKLLSIGAFCIGTNQIDLPSCMDKGVAVFNAPYSNTRSVVELAIAEIIMLMRNIPDKFSQMHSGKWNKSAVGSNEIRGKKLGIIGYGNIGSQLSVLAESMGLNVFYYDLEDKLALGNATPCASLEELLRSSDIISIHVDGRPGNDNLLSENEFKMMKDGAVLVNLSRGHVVDPKALRKAIESGKVKGAGMDVFREEPKNNEEEFKSPLRGLANTILTPHVGGSTEEAQVNIASFVPEKIMSFVNTGNTSGAVNFPNIQLPQLQNAHRLIHIHKNTSGILASINNVLAEHDANIVGQYLKTNERIGYVITDVDRFYDKNLLKALKQIEHTIRVRVLY